MAQSSDDKEGFMEMGMGDVLGTGASCIAWIDFILKIKKGFDNYNDYKNAACDVFKDPGKEKFKHVLSKLAKGGFRFESIKYTHAVSGEKRIPQTFFQDMLQLEPDCSSLYSLCETYMSCNFEFEACSTHPIYCELKAKPVRFCIDYNTVFDSHMSKLIPFFSYLIFGKPTAIESLLLKDIQILIETINKKQDGRNIYQDLEKNIPHIAKMVDYWVQQRCAIDESAPQEERLRILYYSLLVMCKSPIKIILEDAACNLGEKEKENEEYFELMSWFFFENSMEDIEDEIFRSVRELKEDGLKIDSDLRDDLIAIILLIALFKEPNIILRIHEKEIKDCSGRFFESLFYGKKMYDLEVFLSFVLPKRIEVKGIPTYYTFISEVEGGIAKKQKTDMDTMSHPELLTVVANSALLVDNNEQEFKSKYSSKSLLIIKESKRLAKDKIPRYQIVVCPHHVKDEAIQNLFKYLPGLVVIRKVEREHDQGIINKDFMESFLLHINTYLKIEGA